MGVPISKTLARAAGAIVESPLQSNYQADRGLHYACIDFPYAFGNVDGVFHDGGKPECILRSPLRMFDFPTRSRGVDTSRTLIDSALPSYINRQYTTASPDGTLKRVEGYGTDIRPKITDDPTSFRAVTTYSDTINRYRRVKHWFIPRFEDGAHLRDDIITNSHCKLYASHCTGNGDQINPPAWVYVPVAYNEDIGGSKRARAWVILGIIYSQTFTIKIKINNQYTFTYDLVADSSGNVTMQTSSSADFGTGFSVVPQNRYLFRYKPYVRVTVWFNSGRIYVSLYNHSGYVANSTRMSVVPPPELTQIDTMKVVFDSNPIPPYILYGKGVEGAPGYAVSDNHSDSLHAEVGVFTEATVPDSNMTLTHPVVNQEPKWWDGHATVSSGLTISSSTDITTGAFTLFMIAKWHLDSGNTDTTSVFDFNSGKITFKYTTGNDFEVAVGSTTMTVPKNAIPDYVTPLIITRSDTGALKVRINGEVVAEDTTGNQDNLYIANTTLKYHGNTANNSWFTSTEIAFFDTELPSFELARLNELAGGKALTRLGVIGKYKDHTTGTAVLLRSDTGEFLQKQAIQGGSFQFLVDPAFQYTVVLFETGDLTGAGKQLAGSPLPASSFTPPSGTSGSHQIGGRTYENGAYVSATVRVYRQDTLAMLAEVTSASDGNYIAKFDYTGNVVTVIWYTNSTEVIPNRIPVVV